jgi:hypothetical protein
MDDAAMLIPNDSGKVLIAGGDLEQFLYYATNLAFIFDPAAGGSFTRTGSMATPREEFFLTPIDNDTPGHILATGGFLANSQVCATRGSLVATTTNTAEVYDPTSGTWSATANTMSVARAVHGAIPLNGLGSKDIVFGGLDVEVGNYNTNPPTCLGTSSLAQTSIASTDLFDPTTDMFTPTGAMNQSRGGMGAGIVGVGSHTGEVLVAGGACAKGSLKSWVIGASGSDNPNTGCDANATADYSEFYDPGSGTWSVGPGPASTAPTNIPASADLP